MPEFLSAYSTMILPPVYEQLFIMQQMFDLTTKVDISGLEGPFIKLFMMHDTHGVDVLANALFEQSGDRVGRGIHQGNTWPGR